MSVEHLYWLWQNTLLRLFSSSWEGKQSISVQRLWAGAETRKYLGRRRRCVCVWLSGCVCVCNIADWSHHWLQHGGISSLLCGCEITHVRTSVWKHILLSRICWFFSGQCLLTDSVHLVCDWSVTGLNGCRWGAFLLEGSSFKVQQQNNFPWFMS